MEQFRKLGIIEPIVKVIEEEHFAKPSEIQEKAIPMILEGKDVIAGSATGSGKTLAFGAGIIQHTEKGKGVQVLILEPTRELAEQVSKALKKFSKYKPLNIATIYGGLSIEPQIRQLERADIVVGTPGRVMDHLNRETLRTDKIKILVLDEADRMLDMGFIRDIEKIIKEIPKQRQTLLFSATIDNDIAHLARKFMNHPTEISAESYVDESKLHQFYYEVHPSIKFSLLVHLLENETSKLIMIFCNTRRNADFVANNLKHAGIEATAIHGGFSQNTRSKTMDNFNSQKSLVLVCTDIAARGLDIKEVSHVYNYDIPKDSKDYIHRIGRTARAGEEGKAISILTERDFENFRKIVKNPDFEIKELEVPEVRKVQIKWIDDSHERRGFRPRGRSGRDSGRNNRFQRRY